jgi:hypothetical protein
MELSLSWGATTCSTTQDLPSILWNLKLHYRVLESPPLALMLRQTIPVHTSHSVSLRSISTLFSHLCLSFPSGLFASGFHTKSSIHYFMYVCMYVCKKCGPHPSPAPRPSLIYCASPLINPLSIPHFEWSVGLCLWGRHKSHLVPWRTVAS